MIAGGRGTTFVLCAACDKVRLDEVGVCPACWAEGGQEVPAESLVGTISSFTRVHRRAGEPYWLVAVALEAGFRFHAPFAADGPPEIGKAVRLARPGPALRDVCELAARDLGGATESDQP